MADGNILKDMKPYDNDTVSVITPVYNAERFIGRMIESVLGQSYKNIEIILVDDCSKDKSAEIIAQYATRHDNIIYHRLEKNQGAAVARNTALRLATGRYVAFLDSDDIWCEGKLDRQMAFMRKHDAAITCTAMDTIDKNETPLGSVRKVRHTIGYELLLRNTMIATSTVLIDRGKTGDFIMPAYRGGQDYATWLMLMRNGTLCYGLNEVLTHYRVLSESLSSNKWKSVRQVWQIQRKEEGLNPISAAINVAFFIANAFVKHFIR